MEETKSYTSNESELGGASMPIVTKRGLKITYKNPNTPEEVAEVLARLVAESMYKKVIDNKTE